MRSCRANMKFVDVTALEDSAVTMNQQQEFCNAGLFAEYVPQRDYATLERNQFVLDGSKAILPDAPEDAAMWTGSKSNEKCEFENAGAVTVTFSKPHSSAGITLYFAGDYPPKIRITWYTLEGAVLETEEFYPDAAIYVCRKMVQDYGCLKIEILESQWPDTYARLQYILYGLELNWNEEVIRSAKVTEDSDLTSATLPENTATIEIIDENNDFDIENENGSWKVVQCSQEVLLTAVIDNKAYPVGSFYINDFSFKGSVATFNLTNAVGLLDDFTFYDGEMYTNKPAGEIMEQIFAAAGFEKYEIAEDVYSVPLSGYLGISSCRDALKTVCFACGAVVSDDRSDRLHIRYPDRHVKYTVGPERKILGEANVSLDQYVSGVTIECNRYTSAADPMEIYNDTLSKGTHRITFTSPYVAESISVTGGKKVKATVNYIDVAMEKDGVCVVSGISYQETSFACEKKVKMLPAGSRENLKKFGKCSLYNAKKLPEIAQSLLDYYSLQKILSMKYFSESENAGTWLGVKNVSGVESYTLIEQQSIDLSGGFVSTATCRGYNKVVTEIYFAGSELYAGGEGLI